MKKLTTLLLLAVVIVSAGCKSYTSASRFNPYATPYGFGYYPPPTIGPSYYRPAPTIPTQPIGALNVNPYDPNSLANPYGAGSQYKADGLLNPYSPNGSEYSNKSWNNPYATEAPKLYDANGNYRGKLSVNPYDPDSVSNPYGKYGSEYSPESINNPYGAGSPYSTTPIYVIPSR